MTGDEQNPTSTPGVSSSCEMPDVEVDMGSPLSIPGTDLVVSATDFEVERAPGFGIPILSLFKDLPPLPVPDEAKGKDAPETQLTQNGPSPKGRIFSTLPYSSAYPCRVLKSLRKLLFLYTGE